MSKREYLMKKCGLPNTYETSHCFADSTHQTCCMLGPQARKYANKSGNPIDKPSIRAFTKFNGNPPRPNDLTPWCTCFGSKVCSYYANKFNDGTHIKFLNNNKHKNQILTNIPKKAACEEYARQALNINSHNTPGIIAANGDNHETCSAKEIQSIIRENIYKSD